MEELDLKDLFNYFWSRKLYILLMVLLCISIGCVYSIFIQKPMYKSYTTVLLTKESDSTTITSNDITLNKNLVDTYREIVKSNKVMNKVINNLDLDYSVASLKELVTVESINDTEIIKITVINEESKLASEIANEIASVFNVEIIKLYNIQNIGIVDTAVAATSPYNVNIIKSLIIAFLIGFVLSCGVIFVIYYFDNSIKSAEEIESKIGLAVIGLIPSIGGRNE